MSNQPRARVKGSQGPRNAVVGQGPRTVPPSWRTQGQPPSAAATSARGLQSSYLDMPSDFSGSRIFVSNLPLDVQEDDVKELFHTMIGPVKEHFLVRGKNGKSKGMAVVVFSDPNHANLARKGYHNKVIDQEHKMQISLIIDGPDRRGANPVPPPPPPLSLLERVGALPNGANNDYFSDKGQGQPRPPLPQHRQNPPSQHLSDRIRPPVPSASRFRRKKGPKRIQKAIQSKEQYVGGHYVYVKKSATELDQEMDEYRSKAPPINPRY